MGTGYTRADVANNIADGNIINSADLDNEYDAIEAAFNSSTGHTHDGTSAEGGPITVVGPVQDLVVSATEVKPKTTNTLDLGTSALLYKDAYLQGNMYFRDTALKIVSSADGQLDIDADVEVEITAPTLDIDASTAVTINTTTLALSGNMTFGDNDKAIFGAGSDLQIYHNGTDSVVDDQGTGKLVLKGNTAVEIRGTNGEDLAGFNMNGAVNLYYDNAAKLATKTDGVDITGELQADSLDIDGGADITGVVSLHNHLSLDDGDEIRLGTSNDLLIYHDGSNSLINEVGTGDLIIYTNGAAFQVDSNTGENMIYAAKDAGVNLYHNNNVRIQSTNAGATITGTLTADGLSLGDNEKAQFGASNDLQIYHDGSHSYIDDQGTGNLYIRGTNLRLNSSANVSYLSADSGGAVSLYHNGTQRFATNSGGVDILGSINAVDSIYLADYIFHEGDTDTYMQFHNANEWRVVTGGTEMLEVNNDTVNLNANTVGRVETASKTGSVTPNLQVYNSFVWTLTGNITLNNPTTEINGMSGVFIFIHSGAGRTVSLGTDWETAGGAGLTLSSTSGAVDIVPYYVQATGEILLGTPQLAFA